MRNETPLHPETTLHQTERLGPILKSLWKTAWWPSLSHLIFPEVFACTSSRKILSWHCWLLSIPQDTEIVLFQVPKFTLLLKHLSCCLWPVKYVTGRHDKLQVTSSGNGASATCFVRLHHYCSEGTKNPPLTCFEANPSRIATFSLTFLSSPWQQKHLVGSRLPVPVPVD